MSIQNSPPKRRRSQVIEFESSNEGAGVDRGDTNVCDAGGHTMGVQNIGAEELGVGVANGGRIVGEDDLDDRETLSSRMSRRVASSRPHEPFGEGTSSSRRTERQESPG